MLSNKDVSALVADNAVLLAAVEVITGALNDLVGASMTEDGKPKVPAYRDLMRARGMLPRKYQHTLEKRDANQA